jgi:hypothetical protein
MAAERTVAWLLTSRLFTRRTTATVRLPVGPS